MSLSYSQEATLHALQSRAAIEDLDARHGRAYEEGDVDGWVSTFTHSGASVVRDGAEPVRGSGLRSVFETWKGLVHLTLDAVVEVDGVNARQRARFLVLGPGVEGAAVVQASGRYDDDLVYERGAWYLRTRRITTDPTGAAAR